MSKKHFYDPHPGFAGASIPFPKQLKAVADSLAGQEMTVAEAITLFDAAYNNSADLRADFVRCEVKDSNDFICVTLYEGMPSHCFSPILRMFCAIRYKD